MRYIWLLPSVVSSLVFALTTGHPSYLLFAGTSVLIALVGAGAGRRKLRVAAVDTRLTQLGGRWYLGAEAITRTRLLLHPGFRRQLLLQLRDRTRAPDFEVAASVFASAPDRQPRLGLATDRVEALGQTTLVELPWFDDPHTLIVGPTGSGKTVLLLRILQDCLRISNLRVWFFDFKNSPMEALAELEIEHPSQLVACSSADAAKLSQTWAELFQGLNWQGARPNRPDAVCDLVIVDELAAALEQPETRNSILQLAGQGRSAGVRLVCASQSTSGIPRSLLANLMNRIVVGQLDQAELLMLSSRSDSLHASKWSARNEVWAAEFGWLSGRLLKGGQDFAYPRKT